MGAGSRFDQPLTLVIDGRQVVACGPLGFVGCETHAEVATTLRQFCHGIATAHGTFVNPDYDEQRCEELVGVREDKDEDEWMLTAEVRPEAVGRHISSASWSAFTFVTTPGWGGTGPLVRARGVIRYFRRDPGVDVHVWNGDASGNDLEVRWV